MSPGLRPGGTTVIAGKAVLLNITDNNPLNKAIDVLDMVWCSVIGDSRSKISGKFYVIHVTATEQANHLSQ
jgi:hypothetical protein